MRQFMDYLEDFRIFLASRSPRRHTLLEQAGIPFEIWLKEEVEEKYPDNLTPDEIAVYLAKLKSEVYQKELIDGDILITADTIVVLEGRILGKPSGREEAISMLSMLSGKCHEVITGVCLTGKSRQSAFTANTLVWFDQLELSEIIEYVDDFEPFDKAGAYGIQEWIGYMGIHRIEGSYFNVMGLPVQRLYKELKRFTGYN